jgi:2-polyprenyl-6-methoxyphenol hydroxylase-like FAD-dependent oxidoreductase
MMLGLLLARAGVRTVVLEKHGDFLRDFRGDTVHPSTLEVIHELGLLDDFLHLPHQKATELRVHIGGREMAVADFRHLPTRCGFIAFMPQWDFLSFLADKASAYPQFELMMNAEVVDLLEDDGRVVGVEARTPDGVIEIRADLVVGADGRGSMVRDRAGLEVRELGAPIDVLWFGLPRSHDDPSETMGRFAAGHILVMIDRGDYWQCGYVIAKDGFDELRLRGIGAFRTKVAASAPFVADRLAALATWDDVRLLTVRVDRLDRWHRPGLLIIGDAAHAMSPVGGVGINLAIQDAVAAANMLSGPLLRGGATPSDLERVQKRRQWPTRATQWAQVAIQNRIISGVLASRQQVSPPLPVRLLDRWPLLRRIPAYLVGVGVRPEHVAAVD